MDKTRSELAFERVRLVERIQFQRATLVRELAPLQRVSQAGDRMTALGAEVLLFLRQHPLAIGSMLAAVALFKPRAAWRWAKRGFFVWRGWRTVQQWQPGMWLQLLRRFI